MPNQQSSLSGTRTAVIFHATIGLTVLSSAGPLKIPHPWMHGFAAPRSAPSSLTGCPEPFRIWLPFTCKPVIEGSSGAAEATLGEADGVNPQPIVTKPTTSTRIPILNFTTSLLLPFTRLVYSSLSADTAHSRNSDAGQHVDGACRRIRWTLDAGSADGAIPKAGPRHTHAFRDSGPAHNEQELIGRLLDALRTLDYPADLRDVWVVADNCDDETATSLALRMSTSWSTWMQTNTPKVLPCGGCCASWKNRSSTYDAYVVLDADSVVAPNFLRSMDRHLESGSQVIQAYYSVLNASASPLASLRFAALAALHYVRPLGRSVLGLSVGLKGNGMCFAAPVLRQFGWNWFSLAEDVEFHLALVQAGAPGRFRGRYLSARGYAGRPDQAASQNARWERGRLQLLKGPVRALIVQGIRQRSLMQLDAAIEQLIPPLSVPFAIAAACLVAALAVRTAAHRLAGISSLKSVRSPGNRTGYGSRTVASLRCACVRSCLHRLESWFVCSRARTAE